MPRSNKPPPAWAQSVARCTWVRFFPNSARTTRRSPRVPWARTDLRASTAGKNRVQMACRPQREESRMQEEKESDQDPKVNQPVFLSSRTQLSGYPPLPNQGPSVFLPQPGSAQAVSSLTLSATFSPLQSCSPKAGLVLPHLNHYTSPPMLRAELSPHQIHVEAQPLPRTS